MDVSSLIKTVEDKLRKLPLPKDNLPPWLMWCVSNRRTGMSANRAISNAIAAMQSMGIPTSVNADGSPNLYVGMTAAITKAIIDEISENGYVAIAVPPGAISFEGVGGNAGGPVTVIGTSTNYFDGMGTIR